MCHGNTSFALQAEKLRGQSRKNGYFDKMYYSLLEIGCQFIFRNIFATVMKGMGRPRVKRAKIDKR
jgi:hypothetical protein